MTETHLHERWIRRCFELARRGAGSVSPNPLVGAVVVHDGRALGEGWHRRYGEAHAEVNALNAVRPEDRPLIPQSTLYCNLEPCFHHGRTPPCVERVLAERLPRVVISNTDPYPLVAGRSVARMREAGIDVVDGVLEHEGATLNRIFFTSVAQLRPYVTLKWAQSADGFIGRSDERTPITGPVALRLAHRLRSELDAVLVGAHTAMVDNPRLDARLAAGRAPLRIALDTRATLPDTHHLLDDTQPTWILGPDRPGAWTHTRFLPPPDTWADFLQTLHDHRLTSLLVEGGAAVLQQFIDAGLWDEAWVFENPALVLGAGVPAPVLTPGACKIGQTTLGQDELRGFLASAVGSR
ncbi:MAG: bifunctional diaminohydroxyphosphoribosylaminopyrimidine deaminase/5-amino-6-(5-phosphoribosylamino)uracil reductase RibD [Saprospiraceae bacterium]|nr:bifunctional diaminohydroxyphosphoribosylaminopyrimidine deaminase/5-amino-6-(5-phosphoribosylamino)uracil reductase RibD [Saprospiraceae bacterium]